MRILILGAGGVGGYFGARLIEAGADVTFFLREARARRIAERGLEVESPRGDARVAARTVCDPGALSPYDLVVLTCKAYDLDESLAQVERAVGRDTAVLPLLNGLAHLDRIAERLPQARLWGGVAQISSTLSDDGVIRHFSALNRIVFGVRDGGGDARLEALRSAFAATPVDAAISPRIEQDLWDKFVFLTTLAGVTCLMRADIGGILETPAGERLILGLLAECESVARAAGYPTDPARASLYIEELTRRGSTMKSSMLRDIERGGRTEGEHILGDMLERARRAGVEAPLLEIALTHLRAYEAGTRASAMTGTKIA
jgi:2-dehydropantoate 2-reductase